MLAVVHAAGWSSTQTRCDATRKSSTCDSGSNGLAGTCTSPKDGRPGRRPVAPQHGNELLLTEVTLKTDAGLSVRLPAVEVVVSLA